MVRFAFGVLYLAMSSNMNTDNSQPDVVSRSKTPERMPTPRPFTLEPESMSDRTSSLSERTKNMMTLLESGEPLTDEELDDVINSVQNIVPVDSPIQFDELRVVLQEIAHLSHKDWHVTGKNSEELGKRLLHNGMESEHARQILERILTEGNWDAAERHAKARPSDVTPWAVLVTGVNGIRKTTSMYQSWFPQLLAEALVPPGDQTGTPNFSLETLPVGGNSFFRQLDHMIATLCNEDFKELYRLTEKELSSNNKRSMSSDIPPEVIKKYSDLKAAIFGRYRTLSELLGALLLREAQSVHSNCLMETSGRDVAMFHYVDHFFDATKYNKLALHFTIDDLTQAKLSVDRRMVSEIKTGIEALKKKDSFEIVYANEGGPYGSEVLAGVQEASDKVWNDLVLKGEEVGQDWYKATIAIAAHESKPWTARAVRHDGSLGTEFTFASKK